MKITKKDIIESLGKTYLTEAFGRIDTIEINNMAIIDDEIYVRLFFTDRSPEEAIKWKRLNNGIEVIGQIENPYVYNKEELKKKFNEMEKGENKNENI